MTNKAILGAAFVNWQPLTKSGPSHVCLLYSENSHSVYEGKEEKKELFVKFKKKEVPYKKSLWNSLCLQLCHALWPYSQPHLFSSTVLSKQLALSPMLRC